MSMFEELPDKIVKILQFGSLAGFGAAANYLYVTVMQGKKFLWAMFLANLFIAFFTGNLVGAFLPEAHDFRDGIIMASGYCAFPVLAIVEVGFTRSVKRFINTV